MNNQYGNDQSSEHQHPGVSGQQSQQAGYGNNGESDEQKVNELFKDNSDIGPDGTGQNGGMSTGNAPGATGQGGVGPTGTPGSTMGQSTDMNDGDDDMDDDDMIDDEDDLGDGSSAASAGGPAM